MNNNKIVKLFRNEPIIDQKQLFTLRVYELLDGIVDKITAIDARMAEIEARLAALE